MTTIEIVLILLACLALALLVIVATYARSRASARRLSVLDEYANREIEQERLRRQIKSAHAVSAVTT
jgi:hypothetical protein